MSESTPAMILTHLNCPTPAHSGYFLGGDKIGDFLPKVKYALSILWPQDDGTYLCEGCLASIAVEAQKMHELNDDLRGVES